MKIEARVFVPQGLLFDVARLERVINNTLDAAALAVKADFGVTVQTWHRRPKFFIRTPKAGVRLIFTPNLIYRFVSGGTRVRYATMTPGFIAKTAPRKIASQMGRGGLWYVSKKRPRPGIKAREFASVIGEKWDKELPRIMQRAIDAEI